MKALPNKINVAIVDDHKIFRMGVLATLNASDEVNIQMEAHNGSEFIDKIENNGAKLPDVCLLGINGMNTSGMGGFETLKHLKKRWPSLGVLVLSGFDNEYTVFKFLQIGANGYVSKNGEFTELQEAIKQVYSEGFYSSNKVSKTLYKSLKNKNGMAELSLSDKELLFLSYCCTDMSYAEIAKKMNISTSSAEKCRDTLFERFNMHTRASLAVFAVTSGLYYLINNT